MFRDILGDEQIQTLVPDCYCMCLTHLYGVYEEILLKLVSQENLIPETELNNKPAHPAPVFLQVDVEPPTTCRWQKGTGLIVIQQQSQQLSKRVL